ncbi:uncharacterized protein LOC115809273 [Chanos chanos]|uniref:Uncharacterized protein LOC115809273 n=1 Tax=Chanos chanos TaxID=29144 RepID=A0A6J2V4M6_CHACN|nr:uncharacterized protein LOC115809273 [Chanos chanos]
MTWQEAREWCWSHNYTDMVAIQNQGEIAHLNEILPSVSGYYWIGIRKMEGSWTWVGTKKLLTAEAENWAKGEPNNGGNNEDCVEIYIKRMTDAGKWNDESCLKKKTALCYTASCQPDSCSGNGECVETINSHKCDCFEGFYGDKCEHVVKCSKDNVTAPADGNFKCAHPHGDFSYASQCEFSCEKGYQLTGSTTMRCTASATWSTSPPSCKPVKCGELQVPDHGYKNCHDPLSRYSYLSACEFSCEEGYQLRGSSSDSKTLRCQSSGLWSDSQPLCKAVQCPELGKPDNGEISCSEESFQYGSSCTFKCADGFRLQGASEIRCTESAQWSQEIPTCEAVRCPALQTLQMGAVTCSNSDLTVSSVCNFNCDEGFILQGALSMECTEAGHWSSDMPYCAAVECPLIPEPANGSKNCTSEASVFGTLCSFDCDHGYRLHGHENVTCNQHGNWSGETPTCKVVPGPPVASSTVALAAGGAGTLSFLSLAAWLLRKLKRKDKKFELNSNSDIEIPPQVYKNSIDNLAIIQNDNEIDYIRNNLPKNVDRYWIGLTKTDGKWTWLGTNKSLVGEGYWDVNEPNNRLSDENCIEMYANGQKFGKWNDESCTKEKIALCYKAQCNRTTCGYGECEETVNNFTCVWNTECPGPYEEALSSSQESVRKRFDRKAVERQSQPGDQVSVLSPMPGSSLTARLSGPYVVKSKVSDTDYVIYTPERRKKTRLCRVNMLKPYHSGDAARGEQEKTPETAAPVLLFLLSGTMNVNMPLMLMYNHNQRLMRWALLVQGYNIEIRHKKGTDNIVADMALWASGGGFCVGLLMITCIGEKYVQAWTYHYYTDVNRDWDTAREWCQKHHTDMVAIQNKEENVYLNEYLPRHRGYYWLGIKQVKGIWTWVGTQRPLTKEAANWAPGEPNNLGMDSGMGCVEMYIKRELHTGMWNDESCKKLKAALCYTVTAPQGGKMNCSHPEAHLSFGSHCSVSCEQGFVLKGESEVECTAFGHWSQEMPSCQVVQCGFPSLSSSPLWPLLMNCSHTHGNYSFGSTCDFQCDEGFVLNGISQLTCTSTGLWSHSLPTCTAQQCPQLTAPQRGMMNCSHLHSDFSFGSRCSVSCEQGFVLKGESEVECTASGHWSQEMPSCQVVQCESPTLSSSPLWPLFMNCSHTQDSYSLGSTCDFQCDEGFVLNGISQLTCTSTGLWSHSLPTCTAQQCPQLTAPQRGMMNCSHLHSDFSFGSRCSVSCEQGFVLKGESEVECTASGHWSQEMPSCQAQQCPQLTAPQRGMMNCSHLHSDFSFGSRCSVSCEQGFVLKGESEVECTASGHWSQEMPSCQVVQCGFPSLSSSPLWPLLMNCSHTHGNYSFGSTCDFQCDEGFVLNGISQLTCTSTGLWSHSLPTCTAQQCPQLTAPQRGMMNCSHLHADFSFGSRCSVSCEQGFVLKGESEVECTASGHWSQEMPSCQVVQCGFPSLSSSPLWPLLMNCSHTHGNYSLGSTCDFQCDEGFVLNGTSQLTCTSTGLWSHSLPTCTGKMNCSHLHSDFSFGSRCSVSCEQGFVLKGESEVECTVSGHWSQEMPSCQGVKKSLSAELLAHMAVGASIGLGLGLLILLLLKSSSREKQTLQTKHCWALLLSARSHTRCSLHPHPRHPAAERAPAPEPAGFGHNACSHRLAFVR